MKSSLKTEHFRLAFSALALLGASACSDGPGDGGTDEGQGASRSTGGLNTGGEKSSTGGTEASSGGLAAVGGVASGGASGGDRSGGGGSRAGSGGASGGVGSGGEGVGAASTGGAAGAGGAGEMGSGGARSSGGDAGTGGIGTGGIGTGGPGELPKFVGNITTRDSADTDGMVFSDYWDQITPENSGKWQSIQSSIGSARRWTTMDALYDYAQTKGIIFKQHAFVWGSQQPSGNITEADVKSWMSEFCSRYPNTPLIDVVNEPPPHTEPSYTGAIGGGTNGSWQWIINSFIWAREACPQAILILNDYNNIEWPNDNQHFIDIAKKVIDAGAPIDAVGAQSHGLSSGVSTQTMQSLINKLHNDTGLPVYITEYDISNADDNGQLSKFKEHIPFFLETEWIHGITLWGWIDGKTWVRNTGIMRGSSPRPAMTWLMTELGRPVP